MINSHRNQRQRDQKHGGREQRQFPLRPTCLSLALMAVFAIAQADEPDTLQFRVGESIQSNSNVFRLSDSVNTQAVTGRNERADTIAVTTLGIKFNKAYSLQRFELDAEAQDYRYQRYSNISFTAANYAAAWRWSLTPALHGNVTTDRRDYVDNTADVQNIGRVNHRTERNSLADAEYELGARWRVLGGFFDRSSRNSQPATFILDNRVSGAEGGFKYVFRENDNVSYRYRSGRGNYLNQPLAAGASRDFNDREHEFRAQWQLTGSNFVQGRLSRFERRQDSQPARSFSGYRGEINSNWEFTGKTSLAAGLIKELDSYQTNLESYFDGYRVFVAPTYKATEKIAVKFRYEQGTRTFKGANVGFAPSGRRDSLRLASLGVEYQALRSLTLAAALQRDQRSSNIPGFDYRNNSVFVSGLFKF